jgi:hypothetical protein
MLLDAITLLLVTTAVPIVALVVFMSVAKTKRRRRLFRTFGKVATENFCRLIPATWIALTRSL